MAYLHFSLQALALCDDRCALGTLQRFDLKLMVREAARKVLNQTLLFEHVIAINDHESGVGALLVSKSSLENFLVKILALGVSADWRTGFTTEANAIMAAAELKWAGLFAWFSVAQLVAFLGALRMVTFVSACLLAFVAILSASPLANRMRAAKLAFVFTRRTLGFALIIAFMTTQQFLVTLTRTLSVFISFKAVTAF